MQRLIIYKVNVHSLHLSTEKTLHFNQKEASVSKTSKKHLKYKIIIKAML